MELAPARRSESDRSRLVRRGMRNRRLGAPGGENADGSAAGNGRLERKGVQNGREKAGIPMLEDHRGLAGRLDAHVAVDGEQDQKTAGIVFDPARGGDGPFLDVEVGIVEKLPGGISSGLLNFWQNRSDRAAGETPVDDFERLCDVEGARLAILVEAVPVVEAIGGVGVLLHFE